MVVLIVVGVVVGGVCMVGIMGFGIGVCVVMGMVVVGLIYLVLELVFGGFWGGDSDSGVIIIYEC